MEKNILIFILVACLGALLYSPIYYNQKQIIILRDSLANETKDKLYYRTQYLKANTQLIEVKQKCIYCAD